MGGELSTVARAARMGVFREALDPTVREVVAPRLAWIVNHLTQADPDLMRRLSERPLAFVVTPDVKAELVAAGGPVTLEEPLVGYLRWETNGVQLLIHPRALDSEAMGLMLIHVQLTALFPAGGRVAGGALERSIAVMDATSAAMERLARTLSPAAPGTEDIVKELRQRGALLDLQIRDMQRKLPRSKPHPGSPRGNPSKALG